MPFKDHFSAQAADYAIFRPRYPGTLFDYLAAVTPAHGRAWDCATGSGQAALALTERFHQVIATDSSAAQVAHAARRPSLSYCVASAEHAPIADASIDLITAAQAIHWFDLERFYAEVRRTLRPRGVIAVWCYGLMRISPEVDVLVEQFYGETLGPYWPPERRLIEAGYRSLDFPFAPLEAPSFQMHAEWTLRQLIGYLGTWSAVQGYTRARGQDPVSGLALKLTGSWHGDDTVRSVRWPIHLLMGRAGNRPDTPDADEAKGG
jgi:SAM-dependent methyltransferase